VKATIPHSQKIEEIKVEEVALTPIEVKLEIIEEDKKDEMPPLEPIT